MEPGPSGEVAKPAGLLIPVERSERTSVRPLVLSNKDDALRWKEGERLTARPQKRA